MKKLIRCLAITTLAFTFTQPLFAADKIATAPSGDTTAATTTTSDATAKTKAISMSNLLQQLQKAGYIVKSAEYNKDDGVFKIEAVDRHGEKQGLEVNATTGLTADQKKVPHEVTMTQAAKKLEKNGTYVIAIVLDTNGYKATAMDNKGNQQDYLIDVQSGKVSQ